MKTGLAHRHLLAAWLAICVASLIGGRLAAQSGKVDVTGSWALEVVTEAGGTTTPSVTLKQEGEQLSGHYSSATLGEADVQGSVKGNQVTFGFNASVQGNAIPVTYTGTVDAPGSMKGKISLGGLGEGTFTGKKK